MTQEENNGIINAKRLLQAFSTICNKRKAYIIDLKALRTITVQQIEIWRNKAMAVSSIKATFRRDVKSVWDIVTSLENYKWRSDLSKIEILNENQFVEYTKDGFATTFTITVSEPYNRWEFEMENSNMKGHWTGVFEEKNGQTEIVFTEDITAKKLIMKPFVKSFLKKQQEQYVSDLKIALQL